MQCWVHLYTAVDTTWMRANSDTTVVDVDKLIWIYIDVGLMNATSSEQR